MPDLLRAQHERQRQREPAGRRLRRGFDGDHAQVVGHQRAMAGEKRADVAVLADAQQRQVHRAASELAGEQRVVVSRGGAETRVSWAIERGVEDHRERARRRRAQRLKQHPARDAVV